MIFITCAFDFEAKPFVDYFKLKSLPPKSRFRLFSNEENTIGLCITGCGSFECATGTSLLLSKENISKKDVYVNFGICGASKKSALVPGNIIIANKIGTTGRNAFYPDMIYGINENVAECSLFTANSPVTKDNIEANQESDAYDMESFGGALAANELGISPSHIFVVKIVSDVIGETDLGGISKESISKTVYEEGLQIAERLENIACEIAENNKEAFDFSQNEKMTIEKYEEENRLSFQSRFNLERQMWLLKLMGKDVEKEIEKMGRNKND